MFVKTKKTAGTSSEAYLQEALWGHPPGHSVGWQVERDGFCTPRSDRAQTPSGESLAKTQEASIVFSGRLPWKSFGRIRHLRNHSSHNQIREALGDKFWETSQKIFNVRNPFDLLVSDYFFSTKSSQNKPNFSDWILGLKSRNLQIPSVLDESWSPIRYEYLHEDLSSAVQSMGLPAPDELPSYKSGIRPAGTRQYRDFYTLREREIVENLYGDWLQNFGYRF